MNNNIKPIFIFSLPRAGSTLLQRILHAHTKIASTPEPWILLPFVYAYKKDGVLTEYAHNNSYVAINEFIKTLPSNQNDYYEALNNFILSLYKKKANAQHKYFLDKTPRYYLIINEIVKIFPNAKFIFLFRNPLQVYSSIMKTWGNNRFKNIFKSNIDLYHGPKCLANGYKLLNDRAIAIQYEILVENPEICIKQIMKYLELDFSNNLLSKINNSTLQGKLGDQTGVYEYNSIENKQTLKKWKETFKKNSFRKYIIKNYIEQLDEEILRTMGYDKSFIKKEVNNIEPHYNFTIVRDLIDYSFSKIVMKLKLNIFFSKSLRWSKNKFLS